MNDHRHIIPLKAILVVLLLLFVYITAIQVFGQEKWSSSTLEKLHSANRDEFREMVEKRYDSIKIINNSADRTALAGQLFELTAQKDDGAHVYSLVFRKMHTLDAADGQFQEADLLARQINDYDGICLVEYSRANYFLTHKRYDSAMFYLLNYRDLTPPDWSAEGYRNIINLMGDIYYYAGLYVEATKIYQQLLAQYQKTGNWNHYRPYVLMNNLGQIALNHNHTAEAENWFRRSLLLAEEHLKTDYRFNTLAYINTKLVETAMQQNNLEKASKLMADITSFAVSNLGADVWKEILWQQANLLVRQQDYASAKKKLLDWQNFESNSGQTTISLSEKYALLSKIFEAQHQLDSALYYSKLHIGLEREIAANENLAQSMIILSDRNHALTLLELSKTKKYNRTLLISLAVAAMLLLGIILLAYRLHRSKLALVKQYLSKENKIKAVKEIEREAGNAIDESNNGNDAREKDLIIQLEKYMEGESAFLNPKLGLGDIAEALSTNRTYISQAINNQLSTSFPNYINELRIKEAVKLITSGYIAEHTQEALARECGFSSRSAFIAAFKRVTSVVPSFFIANYTK